ncbi:MAG: hypothetical protein A2Y03_05540 [Omnitrophica WOR_2 bacterium GWF2_38_59]|nr:MAG: hypothetical protein A2Y03_05540 [Omnitrophica WOR_2 bacterium GWF2_38_59]OGX51239.1 MAG: hypothetical protein A2243_05325 [Omnitrophica WOR_2 bacterium RIFOXYA2_FULL_38_17]OGX52051.1 MAG: hypothetical protein A2267_04160 [Omnitrophica WOR_2 bacterium RIFOXYA12_FULL_38_10]OGX55360.1 MAG: hypothetical protein A2306_06675 [Omnitrophica WOR_2 bacterium RIFOXYB2_FULL_38_16]OGX57949.1 MAG: hypothetical protein A2447_02100 [Omnitrophica WOR_2 bacterium RIFOXYC2_FULL_38_12]HBG60229.1 hypothet
MTDNFFFLLIGGLGFFFFGMKTMSEGLKKVAGEKLKGFLHNATKLPIIGVAVGAFVTCLIQSSSATTVMVVGFVNAGLLSLKQAISVIMGANIGTTFTAWLVSSMSIFEITAYALPFVGIGFAIMTLAPTKKNKSWGEVMLGLGILFIGLHFMKDAFGPLKSSETAKNIIISFSGNPWLGGLVGMVFTFLLQSSSATIAIVQVLAYNGIIDFNAAVPLILGGNIGTTITAQLAAIGTNLNARRSAMSHTLFNVIGVLYMLIFISMGFLDKGLNIFLPGKINAANIMFCIAIAHSAFNVINTIIFLPFISLLEKASIWLVPKKVDSIDFGTQYLEKHLLDTPPLALEQIYNETIYMLSVAKKAVSGAVNSFFNSDLKLVDKVIELETVTDNLQSDITQYIVDLSQRDLLPEESAQLPVLIHNVNDIERIGDHSQDFAQLAKRIIDDQLVFSEAATKEIKIMSDQIEEMLAETSKALINNDIDIAKRIVLRESHINNLQDEFKLSHIERLNENNCHLNSGFIFLELIDSLEKIGDRLTNIAQSVIGRMKWVLVHKEEN